MVDTLREAAQAAHIALTCISTHPTLDMSDYLRGRVDAAAAGLEAELAAVPAQPVQQPSATSAEPATTKIDPGFRWDGERQHHVPNLLIEFEPVPANSPCDAKGWRDRDALALALKGAAPLMANGLTEAPLDMVLHCPKCGEQHIDAPEDEREEEIHEGGEVVGCVIVGWDNPPHRSHLCHGCGHVWRPADVPTNGVAAVKTAGKADNPVIQPAATASVAWAGDPSTQDYASTVVAAPEPVNPTMTRDELVAAAESIGMRFAAPAPTVVQLTDEQMHHRDSAELRRLCSERDELLTEVKQLRKVMSSKRGIFQAGRDSYETAAIAMNTDDEAWTKFLDSHGITAAKGEKL